MSRRVLRVRGEAYVTLDTVAECYRVEVAWVREVYDHGLLGRGEEVEGATAVAAATLERLATVLRLHRQQGFDLGVIAGLLADVSELGSLRRLR